MPEAKQLKTPQGQILKEARESKGLTLEAVHENTKIPLDVLKAIEEGYTVRTLSPFYLRGFMKMYANYLGISADEVVEIRPATVVPKQNFKIPEEPTGPLFTEQQKQVIVKGAVFLLAVLFVLKVGGWAVGKWKLSRHAKQQAAQVNTASTPQVPETKAETKQGKGQPKPSASKQVSEQKERAAVQPILPQVKPKPVAEAPAQPAQSKPSAGSGGTVPAPTITKKVSATVKARRKAWLQVKVDDNLVFQSTLNEGVTETWQADKSIEIAGRNIFYLDFEVNGEVVGSLGRADRNARRVEITQTGLTVKQ